MQKLLLSVRDSKGGHCWYALMDDTLQESGNRYSSLQDAKGYYTPQAIEWIYGWPEWIRKILSETGDQEYWLLPSEFTLPEGTRLMEMTEDRLHHDGAYLFWSARIGSSETELETQPIPEALIQTIWESAQ